MSTEKISELIRMANALVLSKAGISLTDVQNSILEQVLTDKKLKNIHVTGYSNSTVQRIFCPKLWELLTQATGQKVRINTVKLVLEKLLQEPSYSRSNEGEIITQPEFPSVSPPILPQRVRHNLPAPSCTTFVGREEEIARLLELLSPSHSAHLVSVDGIGGVGKTTLVLEAAYRCLHASYNNEAFLGLPTFDTIIFTSAKQSYLTPFGLLPSLAPRRTLHDIFRQIVRVLTELDITGLSFEDQLDLIQDALSCRRTLLIVDNLETVENQQDVLAFLYELPASAKAIITTREQILFVPVRLTSMPESDGLCLIKHEAEEKGVSLSHKDSQALYKVTGGIPVAINYTVGQLANGYPIQEVLGGVSQSTGDVARFCFETSVNPLVGKSAHKLLMALALFPTPALQDALVQVAVPEVQLNTTNTDLARLRQLSLVTQENNRYTMLPLTREYALAELKAHPDFEREARERWIGWYLSFSQTYAGQDAKEWQGQFDGLEEEWQNLQAVIEWCMLESRYAEMLKFWHNLEAYTHIMGRQESRLRYWDERLTWTAWLIQAAEQRGDWSVTANVMVDRAWTLTSMGKQKQLEEANELFIKAWELCHHQQPLFVLSLAIKIAVLHIQQHKFDQAQVWLNQARELLEQTQFDEQLRSRKLLQIRYYQGEICFKYERYEEAKILFQETLELARAIDWIRAIFCTQNWLADIAIKQARLDEAERLLTEGLRVAEANEDKSRLGFCQRSLSSLAKARGNLVDAHSWGTKALENFEQLGMLPEVEETQHLLETLDIDIRPN
ncbi:tetratricopeptide repeat protein [Aetokthonos hydrillicola Thurmond2011]|jgi:LuxR family glucitol operon transcriptional activator|uniref:Tetratricopeptide repeat protein n=1 Tax=Aetokthonos hydrillicola Thurmond2011 TaxID=2712845 RepID=A0AAP5I5I8_9CYAN|nr:tetratricopeptide repeat protein [Aetokthonos hydrillicola]MBO3461513.1 ATP-binding protein [Aetokthonos hydrillicola CCALA 1050]MBW4584652.1 ATP-binding protein [Aetokthonos hydrillicola CCALA 1050]MDR9895196.1 tetratricopeptide repeat protein [Aetokthonos hydrillicola Thurmond2011]